MPLLSAGMTFSIVARSADGRAFGVAVASKFLAVGAAVPAAEADVGALATQSYANLAFRPQGLALLRTGVAAADVVAGLTADDPGRAQRQLGVVAATGEGATYTGDGCHDWTGGLVGDGYAIQGNILAGEQVVAELGRLLDLHGLYFDKPDPAALLQLTGELADEVAGRLDRLGYRDADLDTALAAWAGVENLEERLLPGRIDPSVLKHLRQA